MDSIHQLLYPKNTSKNIFEFSNQLLVFKYQLTCKFSIHIKMLTINS